jgi:hypothetical protein
VVAPGEDSFGGASCDLVGVGWVFCGCDELEGEDGVVGGEGELELGAFFVELADGGDGFGDVGPLGPGGELAEAHFVIAADGGDGVVGGEPEEEELVVVGGYWRESGGAHSASLACVWSEARRKVGWSRSLRTGEVWRLKKGTGDWGLGTGVRVEES